LLLTLHDTWLFLAIALIRLIAIVGKLVVEIAHILLSISYLERCDSLQWKRKQNILPRVVFTYQRLLLVARTDAAVHAVPAVIEARVIHNGVDLSIFHPANKHIARAELNIPQDIKLFLFVANSIRGTYWKDHRTIRTAIVQIAESLNNQEYIIYRFSDDLPAEKFGRTELRFIPYQKNPKVVLVYYQAADIYLHAAHVDTFPTTILKH